MVGQSIKDFPGYLIQLEIYARKQPLWRKIMARFSDKYRITEKEFEDWFLNELNKQTLK